MRDLHEICGISESQILIFISNYNVTSHAMLKDKLLQYYANNQILLQKINKAFSDYGF